MKLDFFILFFFYLVSILSTLGYGLYFQRIINIPYKIKCLGYSGLIGVFFLTIYSYFSNFFYAHGIYHNLIILFIGLVLFYLSYIKRLFSKKEIKFLVILFSLIFSSLENTIGLSEITSSIPASICHLRSFRILCIFVRIIVYMNRLKGAFI